MNPTDTSKTALLSENKRLRARVAELESLARELREIQDALRISEERYRSVFENTGTATVIIENDMTISMTNARFQVLTGYSREEIEGRMKWPDFVVPEDAERMRTYHIQRRKDRSLAPNEYECRVQDRLGEVKDMHVDIDMISGTLQSVASFLDITAFKQAEAALVESERKLSKLMGNLPGMAYRCTVDESRPLNFVSAGSKWLTEYSPYELIESGKTTLMDLIHPDDRQRVKEQIKSLLSTGRPFQLEYRIITASGRTKWVWEEGVGVVAETGEIKGIEGFISDISEYKKEELQLRKENIRLKTSIQERYKFGDIIGKNPAMQAVYERIAKAATSDANVIIYGESGTGKELVARQIHRLSDNRDRPFVPVNCSAIPETLFESEFFGYKKGAFTGAITDKPGYFDLAEDGTLFLDELGEIGLTAQVKLLRVLEGGGYTPVGGQETRKVRARIVSATNRDLKEDLKTGRVREDFFYRIHIIPITLPPLRERKDDLPLLIEHFLAMYSKNEEIPKMDGKMLAQLYNYDWPGNVRELQNVLQRFITLKTLDFMTRSVAGDKIEDISVDAVEAGDGESLSAIMGRVEKQVLMQILEKNRWHRLKTARELQIDRKTLLRKMKKTGLD
jgi:PAS domain S-box-containing protein